MSDLREKIESAIRYGCAHNYQVKTTADAILALPEIAGWQPIETAPKDGTRVLVWRPACKHHDAHADADKFKGKSWWQSRPMAQPTHWMPLPEPPREAPE